ncbi:MAG: hypothetical protein RLZZ436_2643 [Planctomycetota bacterium]|jgi:hypothetical protein
MLYLAAALALLFTAWVFYAWIMAESLEIRWLRRCLATLSVLLITTLCLGGGVGLTRRVLVSAQRSTLQQLTSRLHQRISDGRDEEVHRAIRFLAEPPAEGSGHSGDILGRLEELHRALDQADASGTALALEPKALQ